MDKGLYVAMTAAKQTMWAQSVHSNNLANANTTGFKADLAQLRAMPVYNGPGLPSRAYALTESPATEFSQGALMETGRDFDIAIEGDGFLAVQTLDGGEAYTRGGAFYIDANGLLKVGNGLQVLGNGGPIAIPPAQKVEIGIDGSISVVLKGQSPSEQAQIDRIKLIKPDHDLVSKLDDGLFRIDGGQEAEVDASVRVVSGFLESSNVNVVDEFTRIMSLARQYEMNVKLMSRLEEADQSSTRMLQVN